MVIHLEKTFFDYAAGSPWAQMALHQVDLQVVQGEFVCVAGTSGSGKSTLLQLLNGVIKPTGGRVTVLDVEIKSGRKAPKLRELRRRVGLVFQFPEQQMFEETVEKDICFGPMNFGASREEAKLRARTAISQMGLEPDVLQKNPLELSGGQMRKAAIASVLAMDPDILVLDEPTATLDPASRRELVELLKNLCRTQGKTVIMVSHRMEELLNAADRWVIMDRGRCMFSGSVRELSSRIDLLESCGLAVPLPLRCWSILSGRFGLEGEEPCFTPESLAQRMAQLRSRGLGRSGDLIEEGGGTSCATR